MQGRLAGGKGFKSHGKGSSTVDLAISSPDLCTKVREIKVLGIEGEHPFSDHCPIHGITDHHLDKRTPSPKVRERPGLWEQESWHKYAKEADAVHEFVSETVRKGCEGSRKDVGTATANLARILTECCRKAFKGIESAPVDKKEDW